jgi:hypothetical protein
MSAFQLWMEAWVASWIDCCVVIRGNDQSPDAVITTMRELGYLYSDPTREELVAWLKNTNREEEIEYLREEF